MKSNRKGQSRAKPHAITRFVDAIKVRMAELRLQQNSASECWGLQQSEISNLLSQAKEKKEPRWKLDNCPTLKVEARLAAAWDAIGLDNEHLFRDLCTVCKFDYEYVCEFFVVGQVTAFCPSTTCHGTTFVPQGRTALVVPFEARVQINSDARCSWCGEKLLEKCQHQVCLAISSGGPICGACDRPMVPCPKKFGNQPEQKLKQMCFEHNEENETIRRQIRESLLGPYS